MKPTSCIETIPSAILTGLPGIETSAPATGTVLSISPIEDDHNPLERVLSEFGWTLHWAARFHIAKAAVPIAACFLAASLVAVARAEDKAQFTGHWNFNQDQSDDAGQKIHDAQANRQQRANNGGGYPGGGGGMGRGGMGGMGGMGGGMGRGRGGMGNSGTGVSRQEWDRLAENPKFLRIDQRSDQFVVIDDSDHAQTFYPDGKKHKDKDADGEKISTKASWEGGALIAETKLPHSEKLTETFRMSEDGKQLHVITRFEASSLSGPVSIRRVYDMGKAPAQ